MSADGTLAIKSTSAGGKSKAAERNAINIPAQAAVHHVLIL